MVQLELTKDALQRRAWRELRKAHPPKPTRCQLCGDDRPLLAHHEDYHRPLEVVWVCLPCHSLVHAHGLEGAASAVKVAHARRRALERQAHLELDRIASSIASLSDSRLQLLFSIL